MRRDPALVVRLRTTRHRWPISSNDRYLIGGVDFLGLPGGALGALAAFPAAALLGEERGDPGAVDEVEGAGEGGEEEEVEEYTGGGEGVLV